MKTDRNLAAPSIRRGWLLPWAPARRSDSEGRLARYRGRLVICAYSQVEGIDHADIFVPSLPHFGAWHILMKARPSLP